MIVLYIYGIHFDVLTLIDSRYESDAHPQTETSVDYRMSLCWQHTCVNVLNYPPDAGVVVVVVTARQILVSVRCQVRENMGLSPISAKRERFRVAASPQRPPNSAFSAFAS